LIGAFFHARYPIALYIKYRVKRKKVVCVGYMHQRLLILQRSVGVTVLWWHLAGILVGFVETPQNHVRF
jgi:hypothetical protein